MAIQYSNIIVAIGNPKVRLSLFNRINEETPYRLVSLVSLKAYVSPSAQVMNECIIEPMAVVHTGCVIAAGCFISAGAAVNHTSMCCDGVHVNYNATVAETTLVPAGTKAKRGEVYDRKSIDVNDLFFNPDKLAKRLKEMNIMHTPTPIDGKTYSFDNVM